MSVGILLSSMSLYSALSASCGLPTIVDWMFTPALSNLRLTLNWTSPVAEAWNSIFS